MHNTQLEITEGDWRSFLDDLRQTFHKFQIPAAEQAELVAIIERANSEIVRLS